MFALLVAALSAHAAGEDARVLVTLTPDADPVAVAADHGLAPDHVYERVLNGFAGPISEAARAGLLADRRVARVEPDAVVTADEVALSWGLDRIDQRSRPVDGVYGVAAGGAGVTAYVVDSGIRFTHADFGGRAWLGFDALGGDGSDCDGHGTHVAGTVGGAAYGVASDVDLVSVRVLDCNGSGFTSDVIAGLDWVAADATGPAVANLSLSAGASASLDAAVVGLAASGVVPVVAAGNNGRDACRYSPARVPEALTVGATTSLDARASWSNYGACVDLFAPGDGIASTWLTSDTASARSSGTSMAAPHVAGAAALYLAAHPAASVAEVAAALAASATADRVADALGPDDLLYVAPSDAPPEEPPVDPPNAPPVADFAAECADLDCAFADLSTDPDGAVASRSWTFGDGGASSLADPAHAYASAGSWVVALTVTDDAGATATTSATVTTTEPPAPVVVTLTATTAKVKGKTQVTLRWTGATTSIVELRRDGALLSTTPNDGVQVDTPPRGAHTYAICEPAGACSPTVSGGA